ncbi:dehydrodolichyl diphosphate synthase complex subunit Dhdds-like [Symsagittifera roscoffensis]|uniref:dehydrodolichyl diphosphate synthase complex subunit Dhdds-like n=1 Tax=Symsagittifera roscoffensis TaxID=84072 RepID=UPI00307C117F
MAAIERDVQTTDDTTKYDLAWYQRLLVSMIKYGPIPQHIAFIMDGNRRYARDLSERVITGQFRVSGDFMAAIERDVQTTDDTTKYDLAWYQRLLVSMIKYGPIPQHIAFIMDGNRRYARDLSERVITGHMEGFETLISVLSWAKELGIKEITVYAFSIENFSRPREEVEGLLDLARCKIPLVLRESHHLQRLGVRIRLLGKKELIAEDLRTQFELLEKSTEANRGSVLNICFAYTSTQEICDAVNKVDKNEALTRDNIERELYTKNCLPLDLLIRTSGEVRLSDFLLWQAQFTCLCFSTPYWPKFSLWDFCGAIRYYQTYYPQIQKTQQLVQQSNHAVNEMQR